MDCPPEAEPADVVLKFAIAASEARVAMDLVAMQQMLKYFCDRRPCRRGGGREHVPKTDMTLSS